VINIPAAKTGNCDKNRGKNNKIFFVCHIKKIIAKQSSPAKAGLLLSPQGRL
jgi:hypothetical protein